VALQNLQYGGLLSGTLHSLVSILTLKLRTHTMTIVDTINFYDSSASLTKTSVCVSLKNSVSRLVFCIEKVLYLYLGLNICTSLLGQRRNW